MKEFLRFWILFLIVAFCVTSARAGHEKGAKYERSGKTGIALSACSLLVGASAMFCDAESPYSRDCYCGNHNALASVAGCLHIGNRATPEYIKKLTESCVEYGAELTSDDFEAAYKNYTTLAKDASEIKDFNMTIPIDVPIKVNSSSVDLYQRAYQQFLGNYDNSLYYGSGVLGYWALVFLIAIVVNWSKLLFPGLVKYFTGPISNTWRKYVTLPAAFRKRKTNQQPFLKIFDFLVPSRLETLILVGFAAVTIACCAAGIKFVENDPIFFTQRAALVRFTADRTGIVVTVIMPLLILFAGRNNFLQWLTRWNFATFIAFHRWVARAAFILVIVHASCFTTSFCMNHVYAEDMSETYVIWGTIAAVAGGIIMVQGMLFLRRIWYEMFILVHIIMASLFIGGAWVHVDKLGYVWFYYATVAVWVFDRVVRLGRIFVFGFPKSEVILLADETLKVVVPKPAHWKSVPGGHAFIHFLRPSCFWQSHPFTFTTTGESSNEITLYCKIKGGVTHGLYQYLASHPGRTSQIRVALEGPYGEASAAKRYDSAVFVAGGNGIPGIYSELHDLAVKSKINIRQSLKLIWVVREYRSLYWFYEEILALKDTKVDVTIFVTKPNSHAYIEEFNKRIPFVTHNNEALPGVDVSPVVSNEKLDNKSDSFKEKENNTDGNNKYPDDKQRIIDIIKAELSHVTFKEGRPSMKEVVHQEISESNGSVAFVTCGHPVMVDDLRHSVVENLDKTEGKRVEFFEQLQVWA